MSAEQAAYMPLSMCGSGMAPAMDMHAGDHKKAHSWRGPSDGAGRGDTGRLEVV